MFVILVLKVCTYTFKSQQKGTEVLHPLPADYTIVVLSPVVEGRCEAPPEVLLKHKVVTVREEYLLLGPP
jgi:hypothetical protein